MNLVDVVNQAYANPNVNEFPDFRSGDTLMIHVKIQEGEKSRIQTYQGICIAIKAKNSMNGHFKVRKISNGIGVERVFPYHSPVIAKIEVLNRGKSRRAKHYYLRDRTGKGARIAVDYDRPV
jgi:large subunit ribosomal protein L19